MPKEPAGTLIVVDAHSLIFQVFHAIPGMTSPSGLPTNALFGFTRDMLYLRTEKKPDYLVCAFDLPGPTFRDGLYPEYKAHRPPPPDDLNAQIPHIQRLLQAMHIPAIGVAGYEADDVIATIARAAEKRGLDVLICTSDKDCRQLIDDRVRLFNLRKHAFMDRQALQEDWGIKPEQVVDLQAMVGDSVDNVPGVPGIGLKTAAKLLQDFGSLDNILENIDKVPGAKKQEALRESREKVALSRRLVRLSDDVPIELDWDAWRLKEWDAGTLLQLFREWGFRSFADQVRKLSPAAQLHGPEEANNGKLRPAGNELKQGELFPASSEEPAPAAPPAPPGPVGRGRYELVDTPQKFSGFLAELKKQRRFAIDLETTHVDPLRSEIVGYSFSWTPGVAYYLPVRAPEGEPRLDPQETLEQLAGILTNPKVGKVNQNIKYDLLALRTCGVAMQGVDGDSMVADYLLHAGERSHGLADLASRYFHHQVIPITELIGKGKNQLRMDDVPAPRVAEYSGEDADMAWRLCNHLEPMLRESRLAELYRNVEIPLIEVLASLEFTGIRLDVPLLQQLSIEMARQQEEIEAEVYRLAGHEFNIASPKQLRRVLFDELKMPRLRKTGVTGEASTDQETLERLAAMGHELPRKIVEHRQLAKLKGTYVDALPGLLNPRTGRVHASFNQTVAATGRLSSSDPNLQNIPVRSEQGRQIRQAFIPEEGWLLVAADYSQIELRLLAHFCGDAELRRAFAEDRDVHALVAGQIFGVAESAVTPEMRRMAKTVNFGVIYGMSAHGLSQRLGIPLDEAEKFIDAYFGRYPKVLDYQHRLLEKCRRLRYVSTILGRRREITGIRPNSSYKQRNQPEREAVNMEIQGSAADLIKLAMLNIHRRLASEKRRSRMLLQIHDELVFEVPKEEKADVLKLIREEMTKPLEKTLRLEVPLKVDVAVGPNWLDVEEVE